LSRPNPALRILKDRALRALARQQVIYQGGQPAFVVYAEGDANDLKEYLNAPEMVE